MKKLKYLPFVALLFGTCMISCSEEGVTPLRGGDEDEDPIVIPPPPPNQQNTTPLDSLNG